MLIVASVLLMVWEVQLEPGSAEMARAEFWANLITWIFVYELALRFYVLRSLKRFLSGYWIDVLAVLPLLRPLRILRVLRLVRLFRAGLMINRWITRFETTFAEGYREYLVVAAVGATLVLTGSMSMFLLEGTRTPGLSSFEETFWWALLTMMAGEPLGATPLTTPGRVVMVAMMLGGMTVFALLTGVVSALMVRRLRNSMEGREMLIDDLEDHIVVCGWNRGGPTMIAEIARDHRHGDKPIVLIADLPEDEDPGIDYTEVDRERIYLIRDDYTRVQVLQDAGIPRASMAILLADKTGDRLDQDRDARTVLAALTIENLQPEIFTSVELLHEENAHALRLAGVEEIVIATEYSGTILALSTLNSGLVHLFNEVLTSSYGNNFYKADAPASWHGESFEARFLHLKKDHGAILLSTERQDGEGLWKTFVNPGSEFVFEGGERIVYLAPAPLEIG